MEWTIREARLSDCAAIAQLNREELLYVAQFAVTAASMSTQVPGGIPSIPDRAVVEQTMQELG